MSAGHAPEEAQIGADEEAARIRAARADNQLVGAPWSVFSGAPHRIPGAVAIGGLGRRVKAVPRTTSG